ncbi:MAG: hypothetical protein HY717_04890 [Planctomycetes bacterium]|nr:hypothetical protein [Planctomycetota bacterium]
MSQSFHFHSALLRSAPFLALALPAALAGSGCQSFRLLDCRIVGGSSRWDSGCYSVTVLLENRSTEALDLSKIYFEMTTFDHEDQVLDRDYPFRPKGEIRPFDNDRIPLNKPDAKGGISRSHILLKDQRGRVLSEWSVGEPETAQPEVKPAAQGSS